MSLRPAKIKNVEAKGLICTGGEQGAEVKKKSSDGSVAERKRSLCVYKNKPRKRRRRWGRKGDMSPRWCAVRRQVRKEKKRV